MTAHLLGVSITREGSRGVLHYIAEGQTFASLREATEWIRDQRAATEQGDHQQRSAS